MISLGHFLAVGGILFGLGLVGFLTRRNFITMFLCAEMMLQGAVINLLAFGRFHGSLHGQTMALFLIAVAACEAGLAMALFLKLYKTNKSLDSGHWQSVREAGVPATPDLEPLPMAEVDADVPTLPVAGLVPVRPVLEYPEASRAV